MINLNRFVEKKRIIVPIENNLFIYKRKKYFIQIQDGWYEVELESNTVRVISSIDSELIENPDDKIKGYVWNSKLIFQNKEVGYRKTGHEIMIDLHLNHFDSWTSIEAIIHEGKVYAWKPNYLDSMIYMVQADLENINSMKGISPELKFMALFHFMELQRIEELSKKEKEEELKQTLEGQLVLSFRRVGATLINYEVKNNTIICDWSIGREQFNSVFDKDSFRVIEAGFCLSGHDKEHSLHSIVKLAQDYDERDLIYKTRR